MQICLLLTSDQFLFREDKYRIEFIMLVRPSDTRDKRVSYILRFPEGTTVTLEDDTTDDAKLRLSTAFANLPRLYAGFNDNPAPVSRLEQLPRADNTWVSATTDKTLPFVTAHVKQGFSGVMAFSLAVKLNVHAYATLPEVFCSVGSVHRTYVFEPTASFLDCQVMTTAQGARIARIKEVTEAGTVIPWCRFPTRGSIIDRRLRSAWLIGQHYYDDRTWLNLVEVAQEHLKGDVPTIRIAGLPVCMRTVNNPLPVPWMPPLPSGTVSFTARKRHVNIIVKDTEEVRRFHVHLLHDREITADGSSYLVPRQVSRRVRAPIQHPEVVIN